MPVGPWKALGSHVVTKFDDIIRDNNDEIDNRNSFDIENRFVCIIK